MDIMTMLKRPFPANAISWRAGATNKNKTPDKKPTKCIALAYIDARDVMERLDYVFGANWQCTYSHADKKTICEIKALINGEWITRSNGAGDSDVEAEKGAISDAFKRAGVMFGIGRYLYNLPNVWVECDEWGSIKNPPSLPDWAMPEHEFKAHAMKAMGFAKDSNKAEIDKLLADIDQQGKIILWSMLDKDTQKFIREGK